MRRLTLSRKIKNKTVGNFFFFTVGLAGCENVDETSSRRLWATAGRTKAEKKKKDSTESLQEKKKKTKQSPKFFVRKNSRGTEGEGMIQAALAGL